MRWLSLIVLAACGGEAVRPSPVSPAPPSRPVDAAVAQVTVKIVEGTPTILPDGMELEVSKILYAHLPDSKNLSMAEVTVNYQDRYDKATLERGPDKPGLTFVEIAGVKVALESVDAYGTPPSASVVIAR